MTDDDSPSRALVATIRVLGARFDNAILVATRQAYAASVEAKRRTAANVTEDVPYGPHARQVLDVFGDDSAETLVLFVHGGGFNAGDKRSDRLFYSNVGHFFAQAGCQAVLANYRLTPEATWPSGIDDVRAAVAWIASHLAPGGRHRPLVLVGQSAGAAHVAGYLFDPSSAAHASAHLAGCVMMSGTYRTTAASSPGALAYYGPIEDTEAAGSPMRQVRATTVPVLFTVSEFDPCIFAAQGFEMAQRLTEANGASPAFHWFAGHNHVSTVHSLGSAQDDVGKVLLRFVSACTRPRAAVVRP